VKVMALQSPGGACKTRSICKFLYVWHLLHSVTFCVRRH